MRFFTRASVACPKTPIVGKLRREIMNKKKARVENLNFVGVLGQA